MPHPLPLLREHGHPPFRAVVLHGGPGAPGCAAGLCKGLLECGISTLEHLQAAHTMDGLMDEILRIIRRYALDDTVLIGHSFGTWLALLFASRYPGKVRRVILTGAAPLEAKYLRDILRTREERTAAGIADTDNYSALPGSDGGMLFFDEAQHNALMAEALAMRERGELLARALRVTCPVAALHGAYDPHPVQGIRAPLEGRLAGFTLTVLPRCGHDPWKEEHARDAFLDWMQAEVR